MYDNAWKCMMGYLLALSHETSDFYYGELKDEKSFIASCNDGFRRVCYLVEAMDEDVEDMFQDNPEVRR